MKAKFERTRVITPVENAVRVLEGEKENFLNIKEIEDRTI